MFKFLLIGVIAFFIFFNLVASGYIQFAGFESMLLKVDDGLNRILHYCEVIDSFLFEPLKVRFLPGYVPPSKESTQGQGNSNKFNAEEKKSLAEQPPEEPVVTTHKYATIYLKTGFTAEGKIIEEEGNTLTIEMDGYPVTFTQSEIASVKYYTK